jgi:class III poly(R)-hydroxyalkanoic acid synthase PhaE subunit
MSSKTPDPTADFQRLARQYWSAWSDFARQPEPMPQVPGWKDGLAWWTKLAQDQGIAQPVGMGRSDVEAALERMNAQAGSWFGTMQQLAGSFAGREGSPAEIGNAWRDMLGGSAGNPVAEMFRRMSGADAHGMQDWMAQAAPFLGAMRGETSAMLGMPAFGLGREQQERLQRLAQAQVAYQESTHGYNEQLARAARLAFERFERKLAERSEPGRQIESARALFDLWIDAAEEAWADVAMSPEYRKAYGEMVNAQMRLRAGVQKEIELAAGLFGLPTRSEVNASHRKLAALEREVRALKAQLAGSTAAQHRTPAATVATAPARAPAPRKSATKSVAKKAAAKPASSPAPAPVAATPARRVVKPARAGARANPARRTVLPQVVAPRAVVRSAQAGNKKAARSAAPTRKKARR